jgi:hypothetical protein
VKQQMQQVTESRKRKFTAATLLEREGKVAELTIIKQERRSLPYNDNNSNNDNMMPVAKSRLKVRAFWIPLVECT